MKRCPYQIGNKLGSGSYGDVYLGEKNGTNYAVKSYKFTEKDDLKETIFLKYLQGHPNIIDVVDFLYKLPCPNKGLSEVMNLANENLSNIITMLEYNKISEKDWNDMKYKVYEGLLSGLNYMHQNNILHLDIKPDNIMLVDGTIKYVDFGIAVFNPSINEKYSTIQLRISPGYAEPVKDPEIFYKKREYYPFNDKSDIFSLGIVLLKFETRKNQPLKRKDFHATATRHAYVVYDEKNIAEVLRGLKDKNMAKLIGKMLEFNPTKRIDAKSAYNMFLSKFQSFPYVAPILREVKAGEALLKKDIPGFWDIYQDKKYVRKGVDTFYELIRLIDLYYLYMSYAVKITNTSISLKINGVTKRYEFDDFYASLFDMTSIITNTPSKNRNMNDTFFNLIKLMDGNILRKTILEYQTNVYKIVLWIYRCSQSYRVFNYYRTKLPTITSEENEELEEEGYNLNNQELLSYVFEM